MKHKDEKPFELPNSILNQLNEFTFGFVLATVGQQGEVNIYTQADSESFFLALKAKLLTYIKASDKVEKEIAIQNMCEPEFEGDEED